MNENLNVKILESYVEIDKIYDNINNKLFAFITKANELVELSEDDYQIEKTLLLNKISLKGYILDSELCTSLNENNITDYSIDELKQYLEQYEKTYNTDCLKYFLALSLYEQVLQIEKLVDSKIELEIKALNSIISDINTISNKDKSEYEKLYIDSKNQLDDYYKNKKLDDKTYNICIQILNDIFNFYISGYPTIPDEYLYKKGSI